MSFMERRRMSAVRRSRLNISDDDLSETKSIETTKALRKRIFSATNPEVLRDKSALEVIENQKQKPPTKRKERSPPQESLVNPKRMAISTPKSTTRGLDTNETFVSYYTGILDLEIPPIVTDKWKNFAALLITSSPGTNAVPAQLFNQGYFQKILPMPTMREIRRRPPVRNVTVVKRKTFPRRKHSVVPPKNKAILKLTEPKTPKCLKRSYTNRKIRQTTEQMELEKISLMQQQTQDRLKRNRRNMKKQHPNWQL